MNLPGALLDARGSIAFWFRPAATLRGAGAAIDLLRGDAIAIQLQRGAASIALDARLPFITATGKVSRTDRPYQYTVLLTHLKGEHWYHFTLNWDTAHPRNSGVFLDGVRQENPPEYERLRASSPAAETAVTVGGSGVSVAGVELRDEPVPAETIASALKSAGHAGYGDEGLRFDGRKMEFPGVDRDRPVYETSFDDPAVLRDWKLEGGESMRIEKGCLVLENGRQSTESERNARHLVCWLAREMPADFLLEFAFRPEDRSRGLAIVFFNTRGQSGENIFATSLRPRDGTFDQYHSGDIDNYHISYWSGGRGTSNLRKNHGFQLAAVGRDLIEAAPREAFQTVRVYKRGGAIRLTVDGVLSLACDDDGKTWGPVHEHAGWIGLRQMAHAQKCEYGYLKVFPLKPSRGQDGR